MRLRKIAVGCLMVAALTGCSAGGGGTPGGAEPGGGTAMGERDVDLTLRYTEGTSEYRLAYRIKVKLGKPVDRQSVCELTEPEHTVTVPVTITLVHTHREEYLGDEPGGVGWREPTLMHAETVKAPRGELRWVMNDKDSTPYPECPPDLKSGTIGDGWEDGKDVTVHGYLTGVPQDDRSGVGLRIRFFEEDQYEAVSGDAKPLTVTY